MLLGKKIVVVMPAYNAAKTLEKTFKEISPDVVDEVVLNDDASCDETIAVAKRLGIKTFVHTENKGYGSNQKTCYREALKLGADVIVMLHPDYQYSPKLLTAISSMVACGEFDLCIGSRILGKGALVGGMPYYKFIANRLLTFFQNICLNQKLSEYHTGYRAFSRKLLTDLPLQNNSDDFIFDNEILAQAVYFNFNIGEISCPAKYFHEASVISFKKSVRYGLMVLIVSLLFILAKWGIYKAKIFR